MNPPTNHPSAARRLSCPACLRAQRTCICHWITPIANAVEVLILQHPLEVNNAKGSARLLHLSLPFSRMEVGEVFAEPVLQELLHAPFPFQRDAGRESSQAARRTILLYPDTPDCNALDMPPPPPLDHAALAEPESLRLVVLDGTWRKSRKMLYTNPLLQALPRLSLLDMPASQYLIRKAHGVHQLSTLEATCYALMRLECSNEKYQPLLTAFGGFVAQQLGYRAQQAK